MKTRRITPETWTYSTPDGGSLPDRAYSDWEYDLGLLKLVPFSVRLAHLPLRKQLFILRNDVRDPLLLRLVDITWRESQALLGG